VKLLLTSAGVQNPSISDALVALLGKPIAECHALCIPTASYGHPHGGPGAAWRFVAGQSRTPLCELGWKSLGILELSALPSIDDELWVPLVRETDALLVGGGDSLYLAHWMRESRLVDLLESLGDKVWVGVSGGSMVMAPQIGEDFVHWRPEEGGDRALGVVDFAIFPHLDHPDLPGNTTADAEEWATKLSVRAYAIDDQTAIRVVDGAVDVISEGSWRYFSR
jgi:dipeptidase E